MLQIRQPAHPARAAELPARCLARNGQPRPGIHPTGAVATSQRLGWVVADRAFGKRTRKPNSVYAVIPLGAALPRTLISDLPGGSGNCSSRLAASGRCAAGAWLLPPASLPIWSCSVWGLPCHSHYWLRGALLPHLFTLTIAWCSDCGVPCGLVQRAAPRSGCSMQWRYVFCGTWPSTGLNARVPDVIRHTALWSSDFPLPATSACARISGSDRPVLLPEDSLPRN
jgi:hypothetical protein